MANDILERQNIYPYNVGKVSIYVYTLWNLMFFLRSH